MKTFLEITNFESNFAEFVFSLKFVPLFLLQINFQGANAPLALLRTHPWILLYHYGKHSTVFITKNRLEVAVIKENITDKASIFGDTIFQCSEEKVNTIL